MSVALTGCGAARAQPDFAAKVNAICAATDRQLGAIPTPVSTSARSRNATIAKLVTREIPIDETELRQLRALNPPASERTAFNDAVAEAGDDVGLLPKIVGALRSGNHATLDAITQQSGALSDVAVASMRRLGLRQCARNL